MTSEPSCVLIGLRENMNPRNRDRKIAGVTLKTKSWAWILILLELALIAGLLGFWHKQRTLQAEASGRQEVLQASKAKVYFADTTPYQQQVIKYIRVRFGANADSFLKILSCENNKLRWDAQNYNNDKSIDIGIAQINSVHGVPAKYLYDWHTNVDIAYQIFKDSGFHAWTCSYVLNK